MIEDMQQVWINEYSIKSYGVTYWLIINWFFNKPISKFFRLMCLLFSKISRILIKSTLNKHKSPLINGYYDCRNDKDLNLISVYVM